MSISSISTSNRPLYRKVYEELRDRIHSGVYPRDSALPSEPKLAEEFGVSLITVRRAIHELALDGLVDTRQGIGNFVRGAAGEVVIVGMSSFTSDVAEGRLRVVRTLMSDNLIPAATEIALKLGVAPGSMLRHLVRLDSEGGVPLSVDDAYIPPAHAESIDSEAAASPVFMHLWQERMGVSLTHTQYDILVEHPGEREQRLLNIGPDTPLLVAEELTCDERGRGMMLIITRYRADRCRLSGTVRLVLKETDRGVIGE